MPKKKLYLILHDIRSAYNVGAIFRTADGAGVSKIYLSGYTPNPAQANKLFKTAAEKMIEKTALGGEKSVAWQRAENLEELLAQLGQEKCALAALEKTSLAIELSKFKPSFPLALILGNEVEGVSDTILEKCEAVLAIPMRGEKESLNVSVAAGIAMYELLK